LNAGRSQRVEERGLGLCLLNHYVYVYVCILLTYLFTYLLTYVLASKIKPTFLSVNKELHISSFSFRFLSAFIARRIKREVN